VDLSQRLSNLETILYVFSPVHTARSGQESLAQGSPWVSLKRCLALKGREIRRNAAQGCESILALSSWPLRAKDLRNLEMSKPQGPMAKTEIAFSGHFEFA
jgi:hypothetical protein